MNIPAIIKDRILLFDGAMGTMLQRAGLPTGVLPETYNLTHPDVVTDIHRRYVEAGSEVVSANTFQANPLKLEGCGYTAEEVIASAIRCGKASGAAYTALDIGPLGQMLEPMGTLTFEEAYDLFRVQMELGEKYGADLILLETFSDLYEMKAAVLAAKEATSLPVIASMTYQADGRTFVGCDPVSAALTLGGLGVDALGVNCSLGPEELIPVVDKLLAHSPVPLIVQANAGLPEIVGGDTTFAVTADAYAATAAQFARKGVRLLGGCCGTDPGFIRKLKAAVSGFAVQSPSPAARCAVSSGSKAVFLDKGVTVIGERINPTGKKKLKEAIRGQRMDYIIREAIAQAEAGADILDVNMGLPEIDEPAMMVQAVKAIQSVVDLPLQIDSADPRAIEAGVRACNGLAVINSVNGKQDVMEAVFPIAKKYGAVVVCLTLDEGGIPEKAEGRLIIARKIVEAAEAFGIPRSRLLVDCLVLTASAQQDQVMETLRAITMVKGELGVGTVLGVSNVSFGLPERERLNATFLAAAFGAGLDAPILNPLSRRYMEVVDAYRVLSSEDRDAAAYIRKYAGTGGALATSVAANIPTDLHAIILQGRKAEAPDVVKALLETESPLAIIDHRFIPALNEVGVKFEAGQLFLPQLMQSADAVSAGFAVLRDTMERTGQTQASAGRILLATVQGDIHDIGKNIVKMLLESYGFEVFDLGKDVSPEAVIEAASRHQISLIGLSALMTTTVQSMKDTIARCREAGLQASYMVGGAVLNPEYAAYVGADYYAKDAMESVAIANRFFGKE